MVTISGTAKELPVHWLQHTCVDLLVSQGRKKRAGRVLRSRLEFEVLEARNAPSSLHHTATLGPNSHDRHHHHHRKYNHSMHTLALTTHAIEAALRASVTASPAVQVPAVSNASANTSSSNSPSNGVSASDHVINDSYRLADSLGGASASTLGGSLVSGLLTRYQISLANWSLTLPTGRPHHPDVRSTAGLVGGYNSLYFRHNTDGSITFWSPVDGVTTAGSNYPRTELRETHTTGTHYDWHVSDGTATLDATLRVDRTPINGRVVVGQIHDNGAGGVRDDPLLRIVYDSTAGEVYLTIRTLPTSTSTSHITLAKGVKLGQQFSYHLQLTAQGVLSVNLGKFGLSYTKTIDPSWNQQGLYFKAGAYSQDNVGPSWTGAEVTFFNLVTSHG
jgi:hypothetical protein